MPGMFKVPNVRAKPCLTGVAASLIAAAALLPWGQSDALRPDTPRPDRSRLDGLVRTPAVPDAVPEVDLTSFNHPGRPPSPDWWAQVSKHLEREEYQAKATAEGFQAPNRAHGFRTRYRPAEVEVVPRGRQSGESWRFSWCTERFGRRGRMQRGRMQEVQDLEVQDLPPITPEMHGSRVVYSHDALVEWYENTKDGLEQGFTIEERPAGAGALAIEGRVSGGLRPELREDGEVDLVDAHGACVLRYGKLAIWDAHGREIGSRLAVAGDGLTILIDDDRDAAYPLTVDPLLASPSWTAESNQDFAEFGLSAATAGDVNGDGFSDVIVGARGYDNGQLNEGRAYVFHGSAAGLSATPAWTSEGNQANAYWGNSVEAAGDVNGDGFSDVIIGAPGYNNGQVDEGRAVVYTGSPAGLGSTPDWSAESNQGGAAFGTSVSTAADVNGDDYSDVIVGAYSFNNGQSDEGRAFVYVGSATGLALTPSWTSESNQAGAGFGVNVATAGDVNGDGYSDVIVGAYLYANGEVGEGRAYAYHGSATGLAATPSWTAESNQADARFGADVALAGDVNGDGYSDVIIGAYFYDSPQPDEGQAFVYQGSATGLNPSPAWTAGADQMDARFGIAVATAGDVNGDGYADVVVGADMYSGQDRGRAYAFEGSAAGLVTTPVWTTEGAIGSALGASVATAGDVNGDGYSDVIVGAWLSDNGQTDEGQALVFNGQAAGLAPLPGWSAESNQAGAQLGLSVASAGDVNGDGYSDVIAGAYLYDNGQTDEGAAFVFHGSATGPAIAPAWTADSNQLGAQFGLPVASAGDVNGDGYSDVIIGAHSFTNGEGSEGRTFVYHGSPSGLASSPAWTAEPDQVGAEFGFSVASAGDVDGDGFSDVIVGARDFDNGQFNEGGAFVYHGSPGGLSLAPDWTAESNQNNARFGWSVATAGDVNGDGFSDVIVGAWTYSNGETSEGRALVYHGSASGLAASAAWMAESNQVGATFGNAVSTAGDVNGDGYSDVIVGAPGYANGEQSEGRAYVFLGAAGGLFPTPAWTVEANQALAGFGYSVSTAGDVNGDGFSDVIIGAWNYDNGQPNEGRAFLYHGSSGGLLPAPHWTAESNQDEALFGSSVAGGGDTNGDGFSDVLVGAHHFDNGENVEGRVFVYYGNRGDGIDRIPRQARVFDTNTPVAVLGRSDDDRSIRIKTRGRTAIGRGRVRLEWEVQPFGTPLDGSGIRRGGYVDTGPIGSDGSAVSLGRIPGGLVAETLYHWRLRIATDSPFFPRSPWLSIPDNSPSEADIRTAPAGTTTVDMNPATPGVQSALEPCIPNPFTTGTRIAYTLIRAAHHRVAVYNVQGREVAVLADEMRPGGRHIVRWDGRDAKGRDLPSGMYFVRLEVDGHSEARKVALTR